jgi:ribose transport system substrate-binding protein
MRRLFIPAFIVALMVGLLPACSAKPTPRTLGSFIEGAAGSAITTNTPVARGARSKTIALVMKTLTNPFFEEMEKGARKAETKLGITLVVKTAAQETSIQQQIEIVEELIQEKVDAIVIAPGDSKELIPVLKKAQDHGIKVVNIDNQLDPDVSKQNGLVNVPFISVDNEKGGYLSAKVISDRVNSPAKAAILEGIREAKNSQDRKTGAERAFNENSNITIVASQSAHWKIDEAHDVIASIFQKDPDIRLVFCANDMMALGVVKYLEEQGRNDVLVAGYDALEQAKQAIQQGKLIATIDQQAAFQGYTGVVYADKLLHGEQVPMNTMVDVLVIKADPK